MIRTLYADGGLFAADCTYAEFVGSRFESRSENGRAAAAQELAGCASGSLPDTKDTMREWFDAGNQSMPPIHQLMTLLTKTVRRVTLETYGYGHNARKLVVAFERGDLITIREHGCRTIDGGFGKEVSDPAQKPRCRSFSTEHRRMARLHRTRWKRQHD